MNARGPRWATAALLGVVPGHFYSLEVGTARVLDGLDDAAYLRFKTATDARYQRRIGPVWTASLATGTTALTVDRRAGRSALPAAASLALNAVAFAVLLARRGGLRARPRVRRRVGTGGGRNLARSSGPY